MGINWQKVRTMKGVGMDPAPIFDMLRSPDMQTGEQAYWHIEGTAFYAGGLEEAAAPVTETLVEALCAGDYTESGLSWAAETLFEIVLGGPSTNEAEHSNINIGNHCRSIVRTRLPDLYQLALSPLEDDILSSFIRILGTVDDDERRWRAFVEQMTSRRLGVLSEDELHECQQDRAERGGALYEQGQ